MNAKQQLLLLHLVSALPGLAEPCWTTPETSEYQVTRVIRAEPLLVLKPKQLGFPLAKETVREPAHLHVKFPDHNVWAVRQKLQRVWFAHCTLLPIGVLSLTLKWSKLADDAVNPESLHVYAESAEPSLFINQAFSVVNNNLTNVRLALRHRLRQSFWLTLTHDDDDFCSVTVLCTANPPTPVLDRTTLGVLRSNGTASVFISWRNDGWMHRLVHNLHQVLLQDPLSLNHTFHNISMAMNHTFLLFAEGDEETQSQVAAIASLPQSRKPENVRWRRVVRRNTFLEIHFAVPDSSFAQKYRLCCGESNTITQRLRGLETSFSVPVDRHRTSASVRVSREKLLVLRWLGCGQLVLVNMHLPHWQMFSPPLDFGSEGLFKGLDNETFTLPLLSAGKLARMLTTAAQVTLVERGSDLSDSRNAIYKRIFATTLVAGQCMDAMLLVSYRTRFDKRVWQAQHAYLVRCLNLNELTSTKSVVQPATTTTTISGPTSGAWRAYEIFLLLFVNVVIFLQVS
jgi:hypothetical protein